MTTRAKVLAACLVAAVLTTAVTTQAFAQPLLALRDAGVGQSTAAKSPAEDVAAQAATAAALRGAAQTQLSSTLADLLSNEATDYSIAASDPMTGVTYSYGSTGGMYTASIVKGEILAALLLQHQDAGTDLTPEQLSQATAMIEQSDNDAASALWNDIGGDSGLDAASTRFGLTSTTGGEDGYWGLTTTSALDQVDLLGALSATNSVLSATSQRTLVGLMGSVDSDQAWGVKAAADAGTTTVLKNGWLSLTADDGLWIVNTVGLVTVDGSPVEVAVLMRGLPDFATGVSVAQNVAVATSDALAALR